MEDNNFIDENERLRRDAINRINHMHSLDLQKRILLRIEEDPKARENYNSFITMCEINELLNKVVNFIKSHGSSNNESYSFNQNIPIEELVPETEFINFALANLIPKIDSEFVDINDLEKIEEKKEKRYNQAKGLYKCNLQELRLFLYYCNNIKPVPIPKMEVDKTVDMGKCFAAGVDPEAILKNNGKWFIEKKDYEYALNNNLTEIITRGTIFGSPIPTTIPIEKRKKPSFR